MGIEHVPDLRLVSNDLAVMLIPKRLPTFQLLAKEGYTRLINISNASEFVGGEEMSIFRSFIGFDASEIRDHKYEENELLYEIATWQNCHNGVLLVYAQEDAELMRSIVTKYLKHNLEYRLIAVSDLVIDYTLALEWHEIRGYHIKLDLMHQNAFKLFEEGLNAKSRSTRKLAANACLDFINIMDCRGEQISHLRERASNEITLYDAWQKKPLVRLSRWLKKTYRRYTQK